jgi:hypothetical protein
MSSASLRSRDPCTQQPPIYCMCSEDLSHVGEVVKVPLEMFIHPQVSACQQMYTRKDWDLHTLKPLFINCKILKNSQKHERVCHYLHGCGLSGIPLSDMVVCFHLQILYFFYKVCMLGFIAFLCNCFAFFSGNPFYNDWYASCYNTILHHNLE